MGLEVSDRWFEFEFQIGGSLIVGFQIGGLLIVGFQIVEFCVG